MEKVKKERFLESMRKEREKRIAKLQQVIRSHLPETTLELDSAAKSIATHATSNDHDLFIGTATRKRLNELPSRIRSQLLAYIEIYNKFTLALGSLGGLEEAVDACDVPISHIEDAMIVFTYLEDKCHTILDEAIETEADTPIKKQGRSKTGEAIFSLKMDDFLKAYSLRRKRRARIIAAIILTLRQQDITKSKHQMLANSIEQRVRNAEV